MPDSGLCGILNVNKPGGMTSHDVVMQVRKITGQKKAGHAGTLDPMATGVLLICLGQATRVAEYLMASDKVYRARIRLGIATDTYDAEGQIVGQTEVAVTQQQAEQELHAFVGTLEQTPPMYSAIKHEGARLYELARRGQVVARQPRKVQVRALTLTEWAPPDLEVEIVCSKGTYVRSLAHELGQRLGCGAHLARLERVASGRFTTAQACSLQELEDAFRRDEGTRFLLPLDAALERFPSVRVDPTAEARIAHGQHLLLSTAPQGPVVRAYSEDGHLLALLHATTDGSWQPHKVFVGRTSDANPI